MNDDVKKVLAMVPQGHKADHAQLWAHLQMLASHIDGEDARTAAAVADASAAARRAMERAVKAEAERDALRVEKEQEWREHLAEKAAFVSEVASLRAQAEAARAWADSVEALEEQAVQHRAKLAAAESALFRVLHAPKVWRAMKNIAKRYFKGRSPFAEPAKLTHTGQ